IRSIGPVAASRLGECLAASDAGLCLRWPTAQEPSASWLRCLAAGRPTVISALAHLADVPAVDPRSGRPARPGHEPIAVAIDLLDEDASLLMAMRRLAIDPAWRAELGAAGRAYWAREHSMDAMEADYQRVLALAAARPAPSPSDLPAHLTDDYSGHVERIRREFDIHLVTW